VQLQKAGTSGWFHPFQLHGIRARKSSILQESYTMHKTMYPSSFWRCGAVNIDANSLKSVTQFYSLYPTPNHLCLASTHCANNDDNIIIVASNCTTSGEHHANAMQIALMHAVANTGATSVFVMAGTPAKNIPMVTKPIQISFPDGKR
jgi:hypothetical protein